MSCPYQENFLLRRNVSFIFLRHNRFIGKGMNKLLLDVKQPSEPTGVSIFTFYFWISRKRVPYVEVERLVRSEPRKIEKWIEGKALEEKNWMVTKRENTVVFSSSALRPLDKRPLHHTVDKKLSSIAKIKNTDNCRNIAWNPLHQSIDRLLPKLSSPWL